MDLSAVPVEPLTTILNKYNIVITHNHGLDGSSGYLMLEFQFDYELEKEIEVLLTNFKHDSTSSTWSLEIKKCHYLGIRSDKQLVSLDIVDELINKRELERLQQSVLNDERLREYLETNVIPLITKKIKYTKFSPQFRFFLSHKSKDKPIMRTFKNGLKFLGYSTWLDESDMPMGAHLQAALKTSVQNCDCFIAWLNEEFFESDYCKAELLYARKLGKIILPFGAFNEIKAYLSDDEFGFLNNLLISNWQTMSFFEVLRRIDGTLFDFEKMAFSQP